MHKVHPASHEAAFFVPEKGLGRLQAGLAYQIVMATTNGGMTADRKLFGRGFDSRQLHQKRLRVALSHPWPVCGQRL